MCIYLVLNCDVYLVRLDIFNLVYGFVFCKRLIEELRLVNFFYWLVGGKRF